MLSVLLHPRQWFASSSENSCPAAAQGQSLSRNGDHFDGQSLSIEKRGLLGVESVNSLGGYLKMAGTGLRLDLQAALSGAARCFDTGRHYGKLALSKHVRGEQPWRADAPWIHGVLNALGGERKIFEPDPILATRPNMRLPDDLMASGAEMRKFAANFTYLTYSGDMEATARSLETCGFKSVRVLERDDALALVGVSPDEKAIVVGFRCATKVNLSLISQDRRTVEENGVHMPRSMFNFASHIKPAVDDQVKELMVRYPNAKLVVTGGSLGASTALQWVSRGLKDGTFQEDRLAPVVPIGITRSVGRARADELRKELGKRLDICVANGDWLAMRYGAREEHGDTLTRLGPRSVKFKWSSPIEYHSMVYAIEQVKDVAKRATKR